MPDATLSDLLEPYLPGMWLAEHYRIWQMKLLEADKFAKFCSKHGLSSFSKNQIICLWQLGLLKADLILCEDELENDTTDTTYKGLIARGINRDEYYLYSDERELQQRPDGWSNAINTISPLRADITLLFHPFRYYTLYHLNRSIEWVHMSKTQFFKQNSIPQIMEIILTSFDHWSRSEQFVPSIKKWNEVSSLCIVTEPCIYERIFGKISYDLLEVENYQNGFREIKDHIIEYWNNHVKDLYFNIGIERLEEIRTDIGFHIQRLDANEWVHTLICLSKDDRRSNLKGHLGGALILRTMAEIIRRASESAFERDLPEEDELGFRRMRDIKIKLYGSNRLLENNRAANVFLQRHGLSHKPRVRFYVEGSTEYGALNYFLNRVGIHIPIINLRGQIKMKTRKGRDVLVQFFEDHLLEDIKDHVYSIVLIDDDRDDNVKVIQKYAKLNQTNSKKGFFGRFFLSQTDFEYGNFELSELEEIIWRWVAEDTGQLPTQVDRELFHNLVKDAQDAEKFFHGVRRMREHRSNFLYEKGEVWGERLMKYAMEHPLKQSQLRQINNILDTVLYWETTSSMELYEEAQNRYMIDSQTGNLISRLPNN